jgi:hypothetical protein
MTPETVTHSQQVVMGWPFWIATCLFIGAYILIVSEKIHKTIVAIFGAALMIVLGIITQEDAFHSIDLGVDWNVVFLMISMMVIINIMKPTGVFEYIAIKSAKVAKGEPFKIMAIFSVVTAVVSAFLDNVTTVLLIAPVTLLICPGPGAGCGALSNHGSLGLQYRGDSHPYRRSAEHHDCLQGATGFHGLCLSFDAGHHPRPDRLYHQHQVYLRQASDGAGGTQGADHGHG